MAPGIIYSLLPYEVNYEPYSASKVLFYLQLLLFSGLAFFLLLPLMKRTITISLDSDWLSRRLGFVQKAGNLLETFDVAVSRFKARAGAVGTKLVLRNLGNPHAEDSEETSVFGRSWTIGTTALWIAALLSAYVLAYYL